MVTMVGLCYLQGMGMKATPPQMSAPATPQQMMNSAAMVSEMCLTGQMHPEGQTHDLVGQICPVGHDDGSDTSGGSGTSSTSGVSCVCLCLQCLVRVLSALHACHYICSICSKLGSVIC